MHGGFLILVQFLIFQSVFTKEILKVHQEPAKNVLHKDLFLSDLMLIEYKEQRSITDLWNNIKNTAKNAWNSLKNLAKNTEEKIGIWIQNVKDRAVAIAKSFEERLKAFKLKITSIIQSILADEDIKKCFQNENEAINKILMELVQKVTTCISNKINGLVVLENNKIIDAKLNETKFIEVINTKLNMCNQNIEQIKCLEKVKEDIFKETDAVEEEVLKTRLISRSFADDILEAVITCSTDGLIQASVVITNVVLKIIQCIAQVQP